MAKLKTAEKIKEVAKRMFIDKGYENTVIRDIASELGINVALVNYHYDSKANLYEIIMVETILSFFEGIATLLNDTSTSFDEKIQALVNSYVELLFAQPNLPFFIINELKSGEADLFNKLEGMEFFIQSLFFKQLTEAIKKGKNPEVNPFQILLNILSMTVFPFITKPVIKGISKMNEDQMTHLLNDRKKLIPLWIKSIIE